MKITEDVRKYAAEQGIAEEDAVELAWKRKPPNSLRKAGRSMPRTRIEGIERRRATKIGFESVKSPVQRRQRKSLRLTWLSDR